MKKRKLITLKELREDEKYREKTAEELSRIINHEISFVDYASIRGTNENEKAIFFIKDNFEKK